MKCGFSLCFGIVCNRFYPVQVFEFFDVILITRLIYNLRGKGFDPKEVSGSIMEASMSSRYCNVMVRNETFMFVILCT